VTATDERTDPAPAGAAQRAPRSLLRRLGPMFVALVALGSSLVALVFTLWPGLKPDPHTTYQAEVAIFAVERGVTFGQYLHRIAFTRERYRERRREMLGADADGQAGLLRLAGEVVYVESMVEGFKHDSVTLRWSLYGARSLRRVRGASFSDVPAAQLDLGAPSDRTMQLLWLPPPQGHGPFRVRVGLYDERDTLLDVADSRPFAAP
jgi:hypothetical protein